MLLWASLCGEWRLKFWYQYEASGASAALMSVRRRLRPLADRSLILIQIWLLQSTGVPNVGMLRLFMIILYEVWLLMLLGEGAETDWGEEPQELGYCTQDSRMRQSMEDLYSVQ
jgi:hypothetical protein